MNSFMMYNTSIWNSELYCLIVDCDLSASMKEILSESIWNRLCAANCRQSIILIDLLARTKRTQSLFVPPGTGSDSEMDVALVSTLWEWETSCLRALWGPRELLSPWKISVYEELSVSSILGGKDICCTNRSSPETEHLTLTFEGPDLGLRNMPVCNCILWQTDPPVDPERECRSTGTSDKRETIRTPEGRTSIGSPLPHSSRPPDERLRGAMPFFWPAWRWQPSRRWRSVILNRLFRQCTIIWLSRTRRKWRCLAGLSFLQTRKTAIVSRTLMWKVGNDRDHLAWTAWAGAWPPQPFSDVSVWIIRDVGGYCNGSAL